MWFLKIFKYLSVRFSFVQFSGLFPIRVKTRSSNTIESGCPLFLVGEDCYDLGAHTI